MYLNAKISIYNIQDEYKRTCLHLSDDPKVTQMLLKIAGDNAYTLIAMQNKHGWNHNFNSGWTALHSATYNNNVKMANLLF